MKEKNLRKRLTTTLLLSMVYLLGKSLILPWVARPKTAESISSLREFISSTMGDEALTVNLFSLGIMPYMTASILFMLFRNIFRQNARGISQTKVDKSMAVVAVIIAVIQAVIRVMDLKLDVPKAYYLPMQIVTGVVFVIGAVIVIVISEINKKNGVGYFSIFILINILSAMVSNVLYSEKSVGEIVKLGIPRTYFIGALLGFYFIVVVVTIIFETSEVRIPIQHVMLNNTFSDEEYLAVKLNPAGTMPIMYTMTFFFLPYYLLKFLLKFFPDHKWMLILYANLNLNSFWGIVLYLVLTAILNYFLAQIVISPEEIAENMKKSGDYIPEIKPGKETKKLLDHVIFKTSMISSISFAILSGTPLFVQYALKVQSPLFMMPLNFMILISIELTLIEEIRTRFITEQYKDFL